MDIRHRMPNLGAALAITAGLLAIGLTTWQPPSRHNAFGDIGSTWGLAVHAIGALMLGAPFIVSLWPQTLGLAKSLLFLGGTLLIAFGLAVMLIFRLSIFDALMDIVPGVLGLIAGALLQHRQRPEVDRALAAERAGRVRREQTSSSRRAA